MSRQAQQRVLPIVQSSPAHDSASATEATAPGSASGVQLSLAVLGYLTGVTLLIT